MLATWTRLDQMQRSRLNSSAHVIMALLAVAGLPLACSKTSSPPPEAHVEEVHPLSSPEPVQPGIGAPVDVLGAYAWLESEGTKLIRQGRVNPKLLVPSPPKTCKLHLTTFASELTAPSNVLGRAEFGIGVVGVFATVSNAPALQLPASGFFLTQAGAFATAYHVVALLTPTNSLGEVVMTRDGRVFPVTAVLAANEANDVAILQTEAHDCTPLPIASAAPVGANVWVVSHPYWYLYAVTKGVVSGYFSFPTRGQTTWMGITADYGHGSSGAPVLSENGAVVGIVSQSGRLSADGGPPEMVFRLCAPAATLLGLVQQE